IVRIMDAAVYVRPCDGGLLWGGYEEAPRFFDMDAFPADFRIADTPLDAEVLRRLAADVRPQLPVLSDAPVREHRGGLPTMTADGQHIVGPAPAAEGFFIAGGCNVAGLSVSTARPRSTWRRCPSGGSRPRCPRTSSSGRQHGSTGTSTAPSDGSGAMMTGSWPGRSCSS